MDDLARRLERIRPGIDDEWSESRIADARGRLEARLQRPHRAGRIAFAASALLATATMLIWATRGEQREASPEPGSQAIAREPTATSGTAPEQVSPIVTRSDGAAHMRVLRDLPDRTEIGVESGRVNFEFDRTAGKQLTVHAGDIVIQVHSSAFAVERTDRGVGIWVQNGWLGIERDGQTVLAEGEHVWLPARGEPDDGEPEPQPPESKPEPEANPELEATRAAIDSDWRDAAREGRFRDAYIALNYAGGVVNDTVDDLLLAADTARMSNHAEASVEPLQRIARDHASDPRAPLANYTLGRVFLHQLGQPRAAAEAFASARSLAPDSSLAEDALAREIEAWSRAGDADRARARAAEYLRAYPDGHWGTSVRAFGGIE